MVYKLQILLLLFSISPIGALKSQTPSWVDRMPFSPSFFGPNSLPVPDFYMGRLDSVSHVNLSVDNYWGGHDYTQNLFLRSDWVLLPKWICLSVWMVPIEHFSINRESAVRRGLPAERLNGFGAGDVYVGTFFALCQERKYVPGIVVGAVLKSASGENVEAARFHDTPGYYFDLSLGKRLWQDVNRDFSIDMGLTTGFLCWQTSQFRQNDAVMWGVKFGLNFKRFQFSNELGGYIGWQQNGDTPMVFKSEFVYKMERLWLSLRYQIGIVDFPYQQLRLGIAVPFRLGFAGR